MFNWLSAPILGAPPFVTALRNHADGRVVERKGIADLLLGLRVDTEHVDQGTTKSGTWVHGESRISKCGSGEVRKRLYEATLSAVRHNPSSQTFGRRLKEEGKPDKVARTAAARKLLLIAHAIYKRGQPFRGSEEAET